MVDGLLRDLAPGQTIAFMELTNNNDQKTRLSREMYQRIESSMIKAGDKLGFKLIERNDLKLIIDEWKLGMSGLASGDEGARRLLGADLIVKGKISLENSKVLIRLKSIRLKDGQILSTSEGCGPMKPEYKSWNIPIDSKKTVSIKPRPLQDNTSIISTSEDESLRIWTDKQRYRVGENIAFYFQVSRPMYVTIIDVTPSGEAMKIFPNNFSPDNYCQPGKTYRMPPNDASFNFEITEPVGIDRIKAIGSAERTRRLENINVRGIKLTNELLKVSETRALLTIEIVH
ncbi:MAG: DUF4384 domain-containing protein [Desulfobacterales bacterium]|nr:DUF4384 domain-containing protein [Desulfobacterales bacterium]